MAARRLEIRTTAEEAADAAAALIAEVVRAALEDRGACHLALAGGSTPVACYERLGPLVDDWSGVHLWLGDERCVPFDHPESNGRLVSDRLAAPGATLHRPPEGAEPGEQARAYGAELTEALPAEDGTGAPVLDLVLLGLGPDGHTCSLFPGHPALTARAPVVAVLDAPKPPPERITITRPVVDAARARLVLTTGAGKAPAVARMLGAPGRDAPVSLLRPVDTTVLVDEAAATEVSEADRIGVR